MPGEVAGASCPQKMRLFAKKRLIAEMAGKPNKRTRSNYDWRGNVFAAKILGKNTRLSNKFQHLSISRPPD